MRRLRQNSAAHENCSARMGRLTSLPPCAGAARPRYLLLLNHHHQYHTHARHQYQFTSLRPRMSETHTNIVNQQPQAAQGPTAQAGSFINRQPQAAEQMSLDQAQKPGWRMRGGCVPCPVRFLSPYLEQRLTDGLLGDDQNGGFCFCIPIPCPC